MGEVRTTVKLTNSVDLGMVRRNAMAAAAVRSYEADALVDTGALSLIVPSFVAEQLRLDRPGKRVAEYADGRRDEVDVTEPLSVEIMGRQVDTSALVLGDEVIIGQIVLEQMDLLIDAAGRRLIPNPAHPDQPVIKVKRLGRSGAGITPAR